jgi:acyl dehydratase
MRWFEDVEVGETIELGSYHFSDAAIIEFARRFDPQPFHVDHVAARLSHFGGLCASGWHTAVVWMRLNVEHGKRGAAAPGAAPVDALGPSPGFQDLKWLKPVYAGDTIRYATQVTDKRALRSRSGWGLVTSRNEGWNQRGELAFSFTGHVFVRLRG